MPPPPKSPLGIKLAARRTTQPAVPLTDTSQTAPETSTELNQRRHDYRASSEDTERVRVILKKLEGTHNFHNYTVARDFKDRSAQRYMMKLEVCRPASRRSDPPHSFACLRSA